MATITKDALADRLAERAELTQVAARDEVSWFFDQITEALQHGDEVRLHGLGKFSVVTRAARIGRNPRTGETVPIPARKAVRFSPSSTLTASLQAKKVGRRRAPR